MPAPRKPMPGDDLRRHAGGIEHHILVSDHVGEAEGRDQHGETGADADQHVGAQTAPRANRSVRSRSRCPSGPPAPAARHLPLPSIAPPVDPQGRDCACRQGLRNGGCRLDLRGRAGPMRREFRTCRYGPSMPPLLALPFPAIDPVAVSLGPVEIKWYALSYIAGLIGGCFYARRLVAADSLWGVVKRPTLTDIDDLIVWVALGVRARRADWLCAVSTTCALPRSSPGDPGHPQRRHVVPWRLPRGGPGDAAVRPVAAPQRLHPARPRGGGGADRLSSGATPISVNGELWGRAAPDFPYAIVFPTGGDVPRYPSQLFEAATEGALLFVIMALAVRRFGFRKPGLLGGIFVLGYRACADLLRVLP